MTNSKTTKRSLLASSIALLLCFAMLLGTTFAWFTDTVTNGVNKIVSGNLDVELWHSNYTDTVAGSKWGIGIGYPDLVPGEKVEADTELFLNQDGKAILWEPGVQALENFRIKNVGSLAFKFMFKLEVAGATKTPEGKDLTDIITLSMDKFTYADNGVTEGTTLLASRKLGDGYVFEGEILPGKYFDFGVGLEWIPSDRDNEFNVENGLELKLGITLLATQLTYEKDDVNGDQYDAPAEYPEVALPPITSVEEMEAALATGGEFKLGANLALKEALEVPENIEATIDLAGYNIATNNKEGEAAIEVKGGELTIINTGAEAAVMIEGEGTNPINANYAAITVEDGVLNIEDANVVVGGTKGASGIQAFNSTVNMAGGKVIVNGVANSYGVAVVGNSTFNMNGGEILVDGSDRAYGIYAVNVHGAVINLNAGKIDVQQGMGVATFGTTTLNIANGFALDVAAGAKAYDSLGDNNLTVNDNR